MLWVVWVVSLYAVCGMDMYFGRSMFEWDCMISKECGGREFKTDAMNR
jgi:hypothetical protein